jgi:DNA-binding Xre family transcriptional regulator
MKPESSEVITMNKPLSTFERKMKNTEFKKAFDESYKELLFSELMISIMEDDDISIRKLAKEADVSPSVIQDLRSGKQHDIKVSNLVKIAHAFGYEVILQKGKKRLTFQEGIKNSKNHLSVIAAAS